MSFGFQIRLVNRFVFGICLFTLSIDGVTSKNLNERVVWVDSLLLIGLVAYTVQAVITLLIFLPRVSTQLMNQSKTWWDL